jgi:putative SOS response-associated peptidase YedK
MCARYNSVTRGPSIATVLEAAWASPALSDVKPEIFPGYTAMVLRLREGERGLDAMRFGLIPFWAKRESFPKFRGTFNARGETIDTTASFREPFRRRRCLVPAESYVEWPMIDGMKVAHRIARSDDSPILFAGVWDRWPAEGEEINSFAIVTTEPHDGLRWIHHRIPVMLESDAADRWMDPATPITDLKPLLVTPSPHSLAARPC